jgi:hypothetical protein
METIKKFSFLSRISPETAILWLKNADRRKSKRIIVAYPGDHFESHYLLPNENMEEKIEILNLDNIRIVGYIDVEDIREKKELEEARKEQEEALDKVKLWGNKFFNALFGGFSLLTLERE